MNSPHKESLITTRCLSTTCVALILTVAALVSYIVYLEADEDHQTLRRLRALDPEKPSLKPKEFYVRKDEALQTYGFFFRTVKEQAVFEKKIREEDLTHYQPPSMEWNSPSKLSSICKPKFVFPTLTLPRPTSKPPRPTLKPPRPTWKPPRSTWKLHQQARSRRNSDEGNMYHACCTSYRMYVTPDVAPRYNTGENLRLVHPTNNRQYFLSETCNHNSGCPLDCGCQQQQASHRALVEHPNHHGHYVIRRISIPGSCKCMNGCPSSP